MNLTYASLEPVPPAPYTPHSDPAQRTFQGIPGIEKLPSGRLLATWYGGGETECKENYIVLAYSDDDGLSWHETSTVIDPPHPDIRAFDATLWRSPDGRIFWFWAQGCGTESGIAGIVDEVFDGLEGVWYSILENPEDNPAEFRFTHPCRIANGIMLNKPTILSDGTWLLPCSLWSINSLHRPFHASLNPVYGAMAVASTDNGASFTLRGAVDVTQLPGGPSFDEHLFLEHSDSSIDCYIRSLNGIARSISHDGGKTWSIPEDTDLPGKDTRFHLRRLASGRVLLITNDSKEKREKMTAFLSDDDGKTFPHKLLLDERIGVSYPDAIQDMEGNIYITYDYKRTGGGFIYLSRLTEDDILAGKLQPSSFINREISHKKPTSTAAEHTAVKPS